MKSLKVCNNNLLVKVSAEIEKLRNGLNVDARNSSRRKIVSGEVVLTSSKTINEGDIVYFPLYAGDDISIDGIDYYIIHSDDVKIIKMGE